MLDSGGEGSVNLAMLGSLKHSYLNPTEFYNVSNFEISDYSWVNYGQEFDKYFENTQYKRDADINTAREIANSESKFTISFGKRLMLENLPQIGDTGLITEPQLKKQQKLNYTKLRDHEITTRIGELYSYEMSEYYLSDEDADEYDDISSYERSYNGGEDLHVSYGAADWFETDDAILGTLDAESDDEDEDEEEEDEDDEDEDDEDAVEGAGDDEDDEFDFGGKRRFRGEGDENDDIGDDDDEIDDDDDVADFEEYDDEDFDFTWGGEEFLEN